MLWMTAESGCASVFLPTEAPAILPNNLQALRGCHKSVSTGFAENPADPDTF